MHRIGYRTPDDAADSDQLVLVDHFSEGRVATITLNRRHADNAITTEMAAQLIEILETIAARSTVRLAVITGAGDRAFTVGGDLRQRQAMTQEHRPFRLGESRLCSRRYRIGWRANRPELRQ